MARDYARDYKELPVFAEQFKGKSTMDCIEAYAKKRKIVEHRAGEAFWNLADDGVIKVKPVENGLYEIV